MNKQYQAYLESDEWKNKRIQLFILRGNKCEKCGSSKHIQVHHKTYKRIFNEKLSDLMVVCGDCHQKIHGITQTSKKKRPTKKKTGNKTMSRKEKSLKRLSKLEKHWIKNDCAKN